MVSIRGTASANLWTLWGCYHVGFVKGNRLIDLFHRTSVKLCAGTNFKHGDYGCRKSDVVQHEVVLRTAGLMATKPKTTTDTRKRYFRI